MKLKTNYLICIGLIIAVIVSELLSKVVEIFKYADEIVAIILAMYIIIRLFSKKIIVLKAEKRIWISCFLIFIIGILSNFVYNIQESKIAIIYDILSMYKIFIYTIGFQFLVKDDNTKNIINFFDKPAKIFLIIATVCMIISQFVDIGMRGQKRFGFYGFNFIYTHAHIYSMMILMCSVIITYNSKKNTILNKYIILSIIQMFSTTKGPSIIWATSLVFIDYYVIKHHKINLGAIIILIAISLLLGQFQIKGYLLKENSPRHLLYQHGIETANNYFPLGSGFATYGSDMAAKHYSDLYYEYGFDLLYGMNKDDSQFANDNYWPMIMGQYGWIGMGLTILIGINFFIIINKSKLNSKNKSMMISIYVYTLIHSIGSSTYKVSYCCILFVFLVLILKDNYHNAKLPKHQI